MRKHNRKSHENPIWGEGYTQGSHGLKGSQHTAAFVAHTGEKTRKPDFATSFVCAHKEREGSIRDVVQQLKLQLTMLANCEKEFTWMGA